MGSVVEVGASALSQSFTPAIVTDPAPGDVLVFLATGANNSTPRNLLSVAGCGATWGELAQVSPASGPSLHVAVGRGADLTAGTVTGTFSSLRYGIGRLYLLRGFGSDATVTVDLSAARTTGTAPLSSPAVAAAAGDVVINVMGNTTAGSTLTWDTAGWTLDPAGIETRFEFAPVHTAGTAYRAGPGTEDTTVSTTVASHVRIGSIHVTGAGDPPPASSALHLGAADVTALHVGAAPVAAAYLGTQLVYTAP